MKITNKDLKILHFIYNRLVNVHSEDEGSEYMLSFDGIIRKFDELVGSVEDNGSLAVYKYYRDFGRMGSVDGSFVAKKDDIKEAFGSSVYLGEALGKHSDVSHVLERGDVEMITDDPTVISLYNHYRLESGYNPLDYIED
jgi:hypothetical protein